MAQGGSIQMNGYTSGVLWTRLAKTAMGGEKVITLETAVQWKAGDSLVIASTDFSEVIHHNIYNTYVCMIALLA